MIFKIKTYLNFLLKSTNQHGVHSPFVYNLLINCFYTKTKKPALVSFKKYKKSLLKNRQTIAVTDFGAGSKIFKSNLRTVSKIAKYAGISNKKAALLIRLTNYFQSNNSLEIGTSLGLSTVAIHLGNPKGNITTLEGCNSTAAVAQKQWEDFQFKNINLKTGDFKNMLSKTVKNQQFDLVYFDGNHQQKATINYFETCLNSAHNNSVFIFDDIHWSAQMETAWQQIKNHPAVTVSIDAYFWGIIFFRKEQEKEHFTIRV